MTWLNPRVWLAIGGLAMCAVLLMLYRAQLLKAYERGQQDAYAKVREASQVVADSWRDRVNAADLARVKAEARADALAQSERLEVRTYYEARPDAAGVVCLPPDRVRRSQAARAAILSGTTSKRD